MKKNLAAESLAGIILGVFILSIVLLGLGNLIGYSNTVLYSYKSEQYKSILDQNFTQILTNIDNGELVVGDVVYVYKDVGNTNFVLFTGALNDQYQYVDHYGNKVDDINTFVGEIYKRSAIVEHIDTNLGMRNIIFDTLIQKYNH